MVIDNVSHMFVDNQPWKRRHFDAYMHRQRILNNYNKSFTFLYIADPYEGGLGGSLRNGGDEEHCKPSTAKKTGDDEIKKNISL